MTVTVPSPAAPYDQCKNTPYAEPSPPTPTSLTPNREIATWGQTTLLIENVCTIARVAGHGGPATEEKRRKRLCQLGGAGAVLKLRAVHASGDFDAYWQYHVQREHLRVHAARYRGQLALAA